MELLSKALQAISCEYSFGIFPAYPLTPLKTAQYALAIRRNILKSTIVRRYEWQRILALYPIEQVALWINHYQSLSKDEAIFVQNFWKKLGAKPHHSEKIPNLNDITIEEICDLAVARYLKKNKMIDEIWMMFQQRLLGPAYLEINGSISPDSLIALQQMLAQKNGIEKFCQIVLDFMQDDFNKNYCFFFQEHTLQQYLTHSFVSEDSRKQMHADLFLSACFRSIWPHMDFQYTEILQKVSFRRQKEYQYEILYRAFSQSEEKAPQFIKHFLNVMDYLIHSKKLNSIDQASIYHFIKKIYPHLSSTLDTTQPVPAEYVISYLKFYGIEFSPGYNECYSWFDLWKAPTQYVAGLVTDSMRDVLLARMTTALTRGGGFAMKVVPAVVLSLMGAGLINGRPKPLKLPPTLSNELGRLFIDPSHKKPIEKMMHQSIHHFIARHFARFFVKNLDKILLDHDRYSSDFREVLTEALAIPEQKFFKVELDHHQKWSCRAQIHLTWDRIANVMRLPIPLIQMLCIQGGLFDPLKWASSQMIRCLPQSRPTLLTENHQDCLLQSYVKTIDEIQYECHEIHQQFDWWGLNILESADRCSENPVFEDHQQGGHLMLTLPHGESHSLSKNYAGYSSVSSSMINQLTQSNQQLDHDVLFAWSECPASQKNLYSLWRYWAIEKDVCKNWIYYLDLPLWKEMCDHVWNDFVTRKEEHLYFQIFETLLEALSQIGDLDENSPDWLAKDRKKWIEKITYFSQKSRLVHRRDSLSQQKNLENIQMRDRRLFDLPPISLDLFWKLTSKYGYDLHVVLERVILRSQTFVNPDMDRLDQIFIALSQKTVFWLSAEILWVALNQQKEVFQKDQIKKMVELEDLRMLPELSQESREILKRYFMSAISLRFDLYQKMHFPNPVASMSKFQKDLRRKQLKSQQKKHFKNLIHTLYPRLQEHLTPQEKMVFFAHCVISRAPGYLLDLFCFRKEYHPFLMFLKMKRTHFMRELQDVSEHSREYRDLMAKVQVVDAVKRVILRTVGGDFSFLQCLMKPEKLRGVIGIIWHSHRDIYDKVKLFEKIHELSVIFKADIIFRERALEVYQMNPRLYQKPPRLVLSYQEIQELCEVLIANSYARCLRLILDPEEFSSFYTEFFDQRLNFLRAALTISVSDHTIELIFKRCEVNSLDLRPLLENPQVAHLLTVRSLYGAFQWCLHHVPASHYQEELKNLSTSFYQYIEHLKKYWQGIFSPHTPPDLQKKARKDVKQIFELFFERLKIPFQHSNELFRWAKQAKMIEPLRWMVRSERFSTVIASWTWSQFFQSFFYQKNLPVRPDAFLSWIIKNNKNHKTENQGYHRIPYFAKWILTYQSKWTHQQWRSILKRVSQMRIDHPQQIELSGDSRNSEQSDRESFEALCSTAVMRFSADLKKSSSKDRELLFQLKDSPNTVVLDSAKKI